jgi:hypothetical protein
MFPDARFVHIHRHPFEVFRSQQHYFDTAMWYTYLQRPDRSRVDEGILRRYTVMFDAFFEDLPLVPPGRVHEVRFDDLVQNPLHELRTLYRTLNLPGFAAAEAKFETYIATLNGYERNEFPPLTREVRQVVAQRWRRGFETWNYPLSPGESIDERDRDRHAPSSARTARRLVVGQSG